MNTDNPDTLALWWRIRAQARGMTFPFPHEERPSRGDFKRRETGVYAFADPRLDRWPKQTQTRKPNARPGNDV